MLPLPIAYNIPRSWRYAILNDVNYYYYYLSRVVKGFTLGILLLQPFLGPFPYVTCKIIRLTHRVEWKKVYPGEKKCIKFHSQNFMDVSNWNSKLELGLIPIPFGILIWNFSAGPLVQRKAPAVNRRVLPSSRQDPIGQSIRRPVGSDPHCCFNSPWFQTA